MTGFEDFDRPTLILRTAQNLIALGFLDELGLFLAQNPAINDLYPSRQATLQSFATDLNAGIESHLWIENRYVRGGQMDSSSDQFYPARLITDLSLVYDSIEFSRAIQQSHRRPLPNGYNSSDLMSDAVSTFGISLDIDGYTVYELGSPLGQDIPQIHHTASIAGALKALGNKAKWQLIVGQLYGQAVKIVQGGLLMPDATRPWTDHVGTIWSGQENPKVGPTAVTALTGLGLDPFMIPSPAQISALRAAQ